MLRPLRAWGFATGSFCALILAFLFAPQWILVELPWPARAIRVWMATAWVGIAFGAAGYAAWRYSGEGAGDDGNPSGDGPSPGEVLDAWR